MARRKTSNKVTPLTKSNQGKLNWLLILIMIFIFLFVFAQPVADSVSTYVGVAADRLTSIIESVSIAVIFLLVAIFFFFLFTGWVGLVAGLLLIAAGLYLAQRALKKAPVNFNPNAPQKAVI